MPTLRELFEILPQTGKVEWIGIRPARKAPLVAVDQIGIHLEDGLDGDHYAKAGGNRQVTLIQAEHLEAVASMLGIAVVKPETVRRNIVVRGINLLAMKDKQFSIGDAVLEFTELCHPCSRMEALLGPGGYNAMRGHGGITARVVRDGTARIGDAVRVVQ